MNFNITIHHPTPPAPVVLRVPDAGQFVQIRHDFEVYGLPRGLDSEHFPDLGATVNNPQAAYPDTWKLADLEAGTDITIPLTLPYQQFWYNTQKDACFNQIPEAEMLNRWAEITEHGRALTDGTAVQQGYADHILGLNIGAKPIRQKMLTMGGNILRVIGETYTHYTVETIDMRNPPPVDAFSKGQWHLINWGTQTSNKKRPNGSWQPTDWGQLNWGGIGYGVPFMVVSPTGVAKILKALCKPIANGTVYSPYE